MLKGLGRILLVGVGAFMVVTGVLFMLDIEFSVKNISNIIYGVVLILAGLSAVFAGLKGKGGFWFTIFSLAMIGLVVYYGIKNASNFTPFTWEYLGKFILSLILQVLYIVGFLFIKVGE